MVYDWPPPWDGLAPGVYELTEAQRKLGAKVIVLSSHNLPRAVKYLSLFFTTSPAAFLAYLGYRLRRGVDVVHGHGHITFWFNLYKLFWGWLDEIPYVFHLHITAAGRENRAQKKGSPMDFWTKHLEWPLHKLSDRLGCLVADSILVTSPKIKEEAVKFYGADPQKILVLENGVNTRRFHPPSKRKATSQITLLYVGVLTPRKNIHLIIEALTLLPNNYHLIIVGRGDSTYERYLRDLVKRHKLEKRVVFAGYVEYPKLPVYYRKASVFILPSSYEGLPKVVLEALASGVPTLAAGFEIKEDLRGFVFLYRLDSKQIAQKVREVVDTSLKVDLYEVRRRFDWLVKAQMVEGVYQKILS